VSGTPTHADTRARARAWHHAAHAAVCDVITPWAHGTIVRATRYPSYFDFNAIRVEDEPGMSAAELIAFADDHLAGLEHRRINIEPIEVAERLLPDFKAAGWRALRLLWMRHDAPPPPHADDVAVEHVPYDAVHDLRVAWHREDFPGHDASHYHDQAREVALAREVQVLAVRDDAGAPIAFAQIERAGNAAEITQVYVSPGHRGRGRGTALTRAAIAAAGDAEDLWIAADDEDRPKELYARLGFRPAWTMMELTRLP
jgi:GNAT superfamily N-acetyltransferase